MGTTGQSSSSSAPLLPLSSLIGPILSKRQPVFFDSSATEEATFQLHYGRGHTVQLVPHPGSPRKLSSPVSIISATRTSARITSADTESTNHQHRHSQLS